MKPFSRPGCRKDCKAAGVFYDGVEPSISPQYIPGAKFFKNGIDTLVPLVTIATNGTKV